MRTEGLIKILKWEKNCFNRNIYFICLPEIEPVLDVSVGVVKLRKTNREQNQNRGWKLSRKPVRAWGKCLFELWQMFLVFQDVVDLSSLSLWIPWTQGWNAGSLKSWQHILELKVTEWKAEMDDSFVLLQSPVWCFSHFTNTWLWKNSNKWKVYLFIPSLVYHTLFFSLSHIHTSLSY